MLASNRSKRRALALLVLSVAPVALLVGVACDSGSGPACAAVQVSCNNTCVNLDNDPANCGACGTTCAPTELCSHGTCASVCGTGEQGCPVEAGGGFCTNLQSDNANCGACGTACKPLERCNAGQCGAGCTGGQTGCFSEAGGAPYCANLQNDGWNCGGCGVTCKSLEACSAGKCNSACGGGQTICAGDGGPGYCANTATDNLNCGACGTACGPLSTCVASACKGACTQTQTACIPDGSTLQPDGAPLPPYCTDTKNDNANCGACFNSCPYTTPLCLDGGCYALDATPG